MSANTDSDCASGSKSCTFTCPAGGTWYACPDPPYFVGCCSSDPCHNTNSNNTSPCPNVHAASFDTSIFDSLTPNNCIDVPSDNWYTCNGTDVPFIGCCASNACAESTGCPKDDVRAAAWSSSREDQFTLFQDADGGDDGDDSGDDGLGAGAIAGIVVGSVAAVVIVIALAWWFLRRRKMQKQDTSAGKYMGPASPYQDSHFSSPGGTTVGPNTGYLSMSPAGVSSMPSSPPLPSESGRAVSELYSSDTDVQHQYKHGSGQHGLGVLGATPQPIPELDSTNQPPEIHEMDGGSRS